MAEVRYTVPGWPVTMPGHSALTPGLTAQAGGGSRQYKDGITGQPGTQVIPAPGPGVDESSRTAVATMGTGQSRYGQGYRPNLYYARPQRDFWPGAGMPVSYRSDNLMPVPAADPRGVPAVLQSAPLQRGNRQIAAVNPVVTWPAWNRS